MTVYDHFRVDETPDKNYEVTINGRRVTLVKVIIQPYGYDDPAEWSRPVLSPVTHTLYNYADPDTLDWISDHHLPGFERYFNVNVVVDPDLYEACARAFLEAADEDRSR